MTRMIAEVAARLTRVRDEFGGGGASSITAVEGRESALAAHTAPRRGARSARAYASNALAQEKTGEFWVEGRLTGGRPSPDFEHCEVAVFVGKNPWQSHGFQAARPTCAKFPPDPIAPLIVIDRRAAPKPPSWPIITCRFVRHRCVLP